MKHLSIILALMLAALGGCASAPVIQDGCEIFKPVYWSKNDTASTVEQIKEHNAAGMKACGWK